MIGFGAKSLGAFSTVVGTPIAIAMDVGAVAAGVLSIARITAKMDKHEKIRVLAETKLNTISGYISKALEDNLISDEEYSLILNEYKCKKTYQFKNQYKNDVIISDN